MPQRTRVDKSTDNASHGVPQKDIRGAQACEFPPGNLAQLKNLMDSSGQVQTRRRMTGDVQESEETRKLVQLATMMNPDLQAGMHPGSQAHVHTRQMRTEPKVGSGRSLRQSAPLTVQKSDAQVVQRTEGEAIDEANRHYDGGRLMTWAEVQARKNSFTAEQWSSIVAAYNRGQGRGARLRDVPPVIPEAPRPAPRREPPASVSDRVRAAGSIAGSVGMGVSGMQAIHESGIGSFLADVPVLGALSSAGSALDRSEQAQEAYRRGDLGAAARHGLGSAASGVKAASDSLTVASGGFSAPVTVPVSMGASVVNAVSSAPERIEQARGVLSNPMDSVASAVVSASRVPAVAHSAVASVSSALSSVSSSARAVTDALGLTTPAEDAPPPSAAEVERQQAEQGPARPPGSSLGDSIRRFGKGLNNRLD